MDPVISGDSFNSALLACLAIAKSVKQLTCNEFGFKATLSNGVGCANVDSAWISAYSPGSLRPLCTVAVVDKPSALLQNSLCKRSGSSASLAAYARRQRRSALAAPRRSSYACPVQTSSAKGANVHRKFESSNSFVTDYKGVFYEPRLMEHIVHIHPAAEEKDSYDQAEKQPEQLYECKFFRVDHL